MTDMGWEKLTNYSDSLFVRSQLATQLSDRPGIQYLLVLAAVGALMALAYRRRGEVFWVAMAVAAAVAFLYVPQSRLWNARLLPFYYLAVYLLGAVGHRRGGAHRGPPGRPPTCTARRASCCGSPPWSGCAPG